MGVTYLGRKNKFLNIEKKFSFYSVALKLTTKCNLNCLFCCEPFNDLQEASLGSWQKIIDKLSFLGTKKICLTGGEPTLYKDLPSVLNYIKSKNMQALLSTNGTLLTGNEPFLKTVSGVRISLHGTQKTHDLLTGSKGAYDKTITAIKKLVERSIPVFVAFVVLKDNSKEIIETAQACNALGVKKFYVFNLLKSGHGANLVKERKALDLRELAHAMKVLQKTRKKEKWGVEISLFKFDEQGECILVYGNGDVFIEPFNASPSNKLLLGNILTNDPIKLVEKHPFKQQYLCHLKEV